MSAINEAYRVLGHPGRRLVYDAELRRRPTVPPSEPRVSPPAGPPSVGRSSVGATPARYPWKLVLAMAGVGAAVVLAGTALYEPPAPDRPDNILEQGSCVEVQMNFDVSEVTCTDGDDLVVQTIVPFNEACPPGLSGYRDRQGRGMACVVRAAP